MENQINTNDGKHPNVKSERVPYDDNEKTPLRDERVSSPEPSVTGVCDSNWNSDDENPTATPEPPQSQPNDNMLDTLENHLNEEQLTNALPPELKDTFKEEARADLGLDFLDDLSESDFAGLVNVENQSEPLVKVESAEPINNEQEEGEIDEELKSLTEVQNRLVQMLERKAIEKAKKKKHKKEKKHKRHRSRSGSSERKRKHRRIEESSRNYESSAPVKSEPVELDFVPVRDCEKSIKIIKISTLMQDTNVLQSPVQPLSIKEKRKLAVERVRAVLHLSKLKLSKAPETEFLVVDTIRKLPSSVSVMGSEVFENPSPLCNNFNVTYKFNSTTNSNINISKWGLEAMPAATTKLLRLTGIDVTRLMELQKKSKMSLHKLRVQQKADMALVKTEDECISTGLFRSLSTQTDERLVKSIRNVEVQTTSSSNQGVFWLDSRFSDSDLSQPQANVMFALKELCATAPSSRYDAERIYNALHRALQIKREEVNRLAMPK